ncbi:MAG: T9SS type A sorting domain-containing protein [Ignavibacteriaceae bacterium]|nr:T9SS type A sorting domain-containing protein [Ignavibacteriaceae bacterium]
MNKIYIFYLSFIIAILLSTLALSQTVVFQDNFDGYTAGQQIACQSAGVWKTWSNLPCNLREDALISTNYSFSGANSVVIIDSNDIVKEIGTPISSGIAEVNFQVFIPTGKSGYFNTLANFNPPTYAWAMQVYLNTNGNGRLDAAGQNAASFTYPQNQWFPIKIVADLSADSGKFYINGTFIHKWQWSKGTFGTSNDKRLDGIDFFGAALTDEMYVDDYNIVQLPSTNKILSTTTGGNWSTGSTWIGGNVPNQNQSVEIVAGATVNLTANITNRNSSTIVNGTLVCANYYLSGSGDFSLGGGGTLQIGSADGISISGASGNIQMTGTRTFNQYANYVFNGNTAQVTGNGLPASVKSLTVNNSAGITLSSNTLVNGTLNLVSGNLFTNSNSISLGTSVTNLGILNSSAGTVIGNFNRWISNAASVLFPVGTSSTKNTPVTLSNVVGSGSFSVSAVAGAHPNVIGTNVLQMYWKLTNGGLTSTDLTFNYLDADVIGDETQYELSRYSSGWAFPTGTNNTPDYDFINNTVFISGISSFSDWTLGFPPALPVELSSFSAAIIGSTVKLNWKTATEINNYGFEVERKVGSQQSTVSNYEKIGFVNGNGNSNSPKDYSFVDNNLPAGRQGVSSGKYSYRLKQIDNDGQFEYSKIIDVDINGVKKFELSQNYPNPFNPATTISFSLPEASNVKLTLYNLLGQEIETLVNGFKESGVHTVHFNASKLNSGIYIYKIETNGLTQTRKMTLVK